MTKILHITPPKTTKHVQALLGLINYYAKFIHCFAGKTSVLSSLVKKEDRKSVWSFLTTPILKLPDYSLPFITRTDASRLYRLPEVWVHYSSMPVSWSVFLPATPPTFRGRQHCVCTVYKVFTAILEEIHEQQSVVDFTPSLSTTMQFVIMWPDHQLSELMLPVALPELLIRLLISASYSVV